MAYEKIARYQRLSPDIQTEWGTYTNPHIVVQPDAYKFRQPAVPLLAQGRSDVIHPQPMGPQPLGYIGDYVGAPLGQVATTGGLFGENAIKTLLIFAAIGLVLYWILKPSKETKSNPCVSDFNALLQSGWTPPVGLAPAGSAPRRRSQTRAGRKSLSRHAQVRGRDSKGRFI